MDTAIRTDALSFPLPPTDLDSAGFRKIQIDRLIELANARCPEHKVLVLSN